MTKAEVLEAITSSGEQNTFRRSANWEKAFHLYNAAHPGSHKNMNCGICFKDVLAWLKNG